jgi:hypothetical protein
LRRLVLLLLTLAAPAAAPAAPWSFGEAIEVASGAPGVFHHLESAGRRNVAVGAGWVAVAWEDNRTGAPQAYVALKRGEAAAFDPARMVSTGTQAFEPAIAALGRGRFLAVWEQDDAVWARALDAGGLGPAQRLAGPGASQASVTTHDDVAYVVWSERTAATSAIRLARLGFDSLERPLGEVKSVRVDIEPPKADQSYPSVAVNKGVVAVAWEDRRHGHTVLLHSHASRRSLWFVAPRMLNEQPPRRSTVYGRGPGVARVGLIERGKQGVAATWLDKRDFTSGYDVYAAFSPDGKRFGANQKVQDEFGSGISQWHAAIAADPRGRVVVVWNDDRDETPDLWMSWSEGGGWSADMAVPGAAGAGDQSSPVVNLDRDGNLHLVWIEQATAESPTQVRYIKGVLRAAAP